MNVVDSSGWLEYFADGPNAEFFTKAINDTEQLIVPSISLFEVFKRVLLQRGENAALQVVAVMQQATVVALDTSLALSAAQISANMKLPLADSIMLATARFTNATLWTQDADFKEIKGVQYIAKPDG